MFQSFHLSNTNVQDDVTPLDEYVHDDDGEFKWEVVDVYNYSNVDVFIINMTSQRWLDGE